MQKKLTAFFAFAIFVLIIGWSITPAQAGHCKGKHKNEPGCDASGTIPLCVTIRDNYADKVKPDENGQYCHGEEMEGDPSGFYVIAHIANGTGNFVLNSSTDERNINLDFSECAEDACVFNNTVDKVPFLFATRDFDIKSLDPNGTRLVDLFLRFNVNKQDKTFEQINFRDADGCIGDPVIVKRLTNGCWTVESTANDEACLFKKTARGRNAPIVEQGKYHMPFFMTLHPFSGNFDVQGPIDVASCN